MSASDLTTTATPVVAEETTLPAPEVSVGDTVAQNRVCPVIEAATIPRPPGGYLPTEAKIRQRFLRKVDQELEVHFDKSLDCCVEHGAKVLRDPDERDLRPEKAIQLRHRLAAIRRTKAAAQFLLTYLNEIEDIALSDGIQLVEGFGELYELAARKDPSLGLDFDPMLKFFAARGAKISEGRERARQKKAQK
jgi:hypothetical protein